MNIFTPATITSLNNVEINATPVLKRKPCPRRLPPLVNAPRLNEGNVVDPIPSTTKEPASTEEKLLSSHPQATQKPKLTIIIPDTRPDVSSPSASKTPIITPEGVNSPLSPPTTTYKKSKTIRPRNNEKPIVLLNQKRKKLVRKDTPIPQPIINNFIKIQQQQVQEKKQREPEDESGCGCVCFALK